MMFWCLAAWVMPWSPTPPRRRASGNAIIRDRGAMLTFALRLAACGTTAEARRGTARKTAAAFGQCAVERAANCAAQSAALVGCAISKGLHCEPERIA